MRCQFSADLPCIFLRAKAGQHDQDQGKDVVDSSNSVSKVHVSLSCVCNRGEEVYFTVFGIAVENRNPDSIMHNSG